MQLAKNRSRQEIIKDILGLLETMPLSKTKVMYRASLSYTQLKSYGTYLENNELIDMSTGSWLLTQKGKQYLQAYKLADQILRY
jgi:predicted transcriptional regulator